MDAAQPAADLAKLFELNPAAPGAILLEGGQLLGMISRHRFLELLSRPHGRRMFLKRSLYILCQFAQKDLLMFPGTILVIDAALAVMRRSTSGISAPIVVQLSERNYRLIDAQKLLIAHSCIHILAMKLLQQKTRTQLIQTEKLATLGQMIAGVAHDIQNPATCIASNAESLKNSHRDLNKLIQVYEAEYPEANKQVQACKSEIEFERLQEDLPEIFTWVDTSVSRLNHLVESLRVFSWQNNLQRQETDIHDCLDNILMTLKDRLEGKVNVIKNYGKLPKIYAYPNQLSQVFMNLIMNAVDGLESQNGTRKQPGKIWIETNLRGCTPQERLGMKMLSPEQLESLLEAQSSEQLEGGVKSLNWLETELLKDPSCCVVIRIRDNGPGILSEKQNQPSGHQGKGLGLGISRQIITDKHQGHINLKSKVGKGTEFEILLPLAQSES
ncbi:MAG: ATP-binding protein [Oscillatoriales cyanobacterium RM1_1_9]|nr:ATP-binding protein [Oscillatoriales cyanobacterium RM1_1_9]